MVSDRGVSRKPLIVGNWKMNLLRDSSIALVHGIIDSLSAAEDIEVGVCPPAVYLHDVGAALRGSALGLGAQNMHYEAEGAYTGEVSGLMLRDLGCQYVILGHSERRQYFGETDALVNRKCQTALQHGLTPIVCVGETLAEREADQTAKVIESQVRGSLAGLTAEQGRSLVLAYEPVWAIGTGRTATPEQAEQVHAQIRGLLAELLANPWPRQFAFNMGAASSPTMPPN